MDERLNFGRIRNRIVFYIIFVLTILCVVLFVFMTLFSMYFFKNDRERFYISFLETKVATLERRIDRYIDYSSSVSYKMKDFSPDKNNIDLFMEPFLKDIVSGDLAGIYKIESSDSLSYHYKFKELKFEIPDISPNINRFDIVSSCGNEYIIVTRCVYCNYNHSAGIHLYFTIEKLFNNILNSYSYKNEPDIILVKKDVNGKFLSVFDRKIDKDFVEDANNTEKKYLQFQMCSTKDSFYIYKSIRNSDYCLVLLLDKSVFNAGLNISALFLLLLIVLITGIGVFGVVFFLKPIERVFYRYINKLDVVNNEKTAQIEQIYAQLLSEKEKNERYLDIIGVILLSLDINGIVTMINKKGCDVTGFCEADIKGKSWIGEFVPEEEQDNLSRILADITSKNNEEKEIFYESYILNANNEKKIINWIIVPIYDVPKNVIGVIMSGDDITDKRKLEDEYRQSQKMESIGRLAGGVAHDFNNLLTVIIGNTDIILSEIDESSHFYKDLESIAKAANRAVSLTDQLLAFSRKQILNQQIFIINNSIANVTKMLKRLLGENIRIDTRLADDLYKVKADKGQIEQILLNLAVNARDAMPSGGVINISTRNIHIDSYYCRYNSDARPGQFVNISFTDTGAGIPDDIQKNIFEPFFTTKEMGKGTGLGLSVVYGIIKQHGGWITLKSKLGEGTSFYIYLPALLDDTEESADEQEDFDKYAGRGETILFIEDEDDIRKIISAILTKKGYNILTASNMKESLEIFNRNHKNIDMIFSDVVLPDGSGFDIVKEINKKKKKFKVVLCSGYIGDHNELEEVTAKGYSFIQKPYSIIEILKIFRNIFDNADS